ncbi:MAG: hypothetical protein JWP78_3902 [Mucilaginibacter sp.]|nr:hypothetical protein [Mucilaginibacter sp.]
MKAAKMLGQFITEKQTDFPYGIKSRRIITEILKSNLLTTYL